jgi:hypothetical protein
MLHLAGKGIFLDDHKGKGQSHYFGLFPLPLRYMLMRALMKKQVTEVTCSTAE